MNCTGAQVGWKTSQGRNTW